MIDVDTVLGFLAFASLILAQFFAVVFAHGDPSKLAQSSAKGMAANALGLDVPPTLRARADEVRVDPPRLVTEGLTDQGPLQRIDRPILRYAHLVAASRQPRTEASARRVDSAIRNGSTDETVRAAGAAASDGAWRVAEGDLLS